MKKRLIVAFIGLPILFVLLMAAPPLGTFIVVSLITIIAAYEFMRVVAVNSSVNMRVFTMLSAAVIPAITYYANSSPALNYLICGTAVLFVSGVFAEAIRRYDAGQRLYMGELFGSLFAGVMIPWFLSTLINVRMTKYGYLYVMMPFFISMMSDTGGFFFGKYFGNQKAFPKVSPNKTIAGCVGGVIFAICGAMLFGLLALLLEDISFRFFALSLCGAIGSFASQLGDLAFSLIKRQCNIKDYGYILPGHGGILDRFDSIIFSAPIIFMTAEILKIF